MFWLAIAGLIAATGGILAGSWVHQGKLQRLERRILLLASQKGRITFVDVVRECDIAPDLARQLLDEMGLKGHLSPQVTKDGAMVYRLVDIAADDRGASASGSSVAPPVAHQAPESSEDERPDPRRESVR